jgi:hypothetical protein
MDIAHQQQETAARRAPRSIIAVLQEQHSQIRQLFAQVNATRGEDRRMSFDRLRELLAIHEAGEEIVLRPVSVKLAGAPVANARNTEEKEAAAVLAELEGLDVDGTEFAEKFARFEHDVNEHAEHEEQEEFPIVNAGCAEQEQREMAQRLLDAEQKAPTHPHPGSAGSPHAQRVVGVFGPQDPNSPDELGRDGRVAFDMGLFFQKGLKMGSGQCNVKAYNRQLRDLIAAHKAEPSFVVSHSLSLDEAPDAYARFDRREDGWTKVVLHP